MPIYGAVTIWSRHWRYKPMSLPTDEERSTQHHYRLIEALSESERRYRELVNNLKEVVFQTDAGGLWTFLNPAWFEVTGFSVEE